MVELVHACVGVQGVRLAGFEGIEPDQQARRLEDGALPHLVSPPRRDSRRTNDGRMFHMSSIEDELADDHFGRQFANLYHRAAFRPVRYTAHLRFKQKKVPAHRL
jgi:hypothetical protein